MLILFLNFYLGRKSAENDKGHDRSKIRQKREVSCHRKKILLNELSDFVLSEHDIFQ